MCMDDHHTQTNMSQTLTPCRTIPPLNSSHSGPPTCCMHVHQPQSQICKPGEPLALREVKHPHKGRTSVSRFPLAKQGISSQYSSCLEEIGRFPRDPCKLYLKSDLQPAIHASQKQEIPLQVNTEKVKEHVDWVHSDIFVEKAFQGEFPGRVEHARHFPAPMEMCMDDHHTQTTERTQ